MDELKQKLQEELEGKNGGVSAAVYHNGSTEFYSYGTDSPDENSLYEIGSITKIFTALLFLILESKGQIDRHDPIKKYLPEIDFQDSRVADITLEQLVLHSSGLPRMPDNMPRSNPENPYVDYTYSHLYSFLSNHKLNHESIGKVEYSNVGYGLLGHILELVSNVAYAELLDREIFQPLGMLQSFHIKSPRDKTDTLQQGYNETGQKVPCWHSGVLTGRGGVISSVYDMSLFLEAQINPPDDILGQHIRASQKSLVSSNNGFQHAIGWVVITLQSGSDLIWHNGQTGGYRSFMGCVSEENFGMVMLSNRRLLGLDEIAAEIFGVV